MIAVLQRPLEACWSEIEFFFVLTYSGLATNKRIEVQFLNADTNVVLTSVSYPCLASSGTMKIEQVNKLLDPFVSYSLPANLIGTPADLIASQEITGTNRMKYKIRFRPTYAGSTEGWTDDNTIHYVIKGGIDDMRFAKEYETNQFGYTQNLFFPRGKRFLTWMPDGRTVLPTEMQWLTYTSEQNAGPASVSYLVTFADGTTTSITKSLPNALANNKWKLWHIPVGVNQCNLSPLGKRINYYVVRVNHVTQTEHKIYVDYRADYTPLTLYYLNSMGGLDNIRLKGDIEFAGASFTKQDYRVLRSEGRLGENNIFKSNARILFKGTTDFISKQHKMAVFELFNTRFAAIKWYDALLPMMVPAQDMAAILTSDNLHDCSIELQSAGTFRHMPRQLMDLIES